MLYTTSTFSFQRTGMLCVALCVLFVFDTGAQSTQVAANKVIESAPAHGMEGYTWVAFSSTDYARALDKHREFRVLGYDCGILKALVDRQVYYRIVFGRHNSSKEARAAREKLNAVLPYDAWLLRLKSSHVLVPEADWLPVLPVAESKLTGDTITAVDDTENGLTPALQDAASTTQKEKVSTAKSEVDPEPATQESTIKKTDEESNPSATTRSFSSFLNRHIEAELQFSNIYEDNIDHDDDIEAIQSYGMVPALQLRFRSGGADPLLTLEYLVARHAYSNTERWDRVSNAFRGSLEPKISEAFHAKTSVELSLKGSSEDRDISNQFQIAQELEYRFTRRHRLQFYGTYRIKRFPDQPGAKDFKPNVGLNFERTNSDGERFESGARYEFNKEEEVRGNYKRWTFTVGYRTPEINKRNQFEVDVKHRRKFYRARFVEIEDEDFLRQDNRLSVGLGWIHNFNRGVSMELGYEFETRGSNDPDRLYEANAFSLAMIYEL